MAKQYKPDEVRELLVGIWQAEWATRTGGVAKAFIIFFENGRFDQGTSVENSVYQRYVGQTDFIGGYNTNWTDLGTYRIDDAGRVILSYPNGRESRPIEISQSGRELRLGEIFYTKRR